MMAPPTPVPEIKPDRTYEYLAEIDRGICAMEQLLYVLNALHPPDFDADPDETHDRMMRRCATLVAERIAVLASDLDELRGKLPP